MILTVCKAASLSLAALLLIRKWISSRWATFTINIDCSNLIVVITGATSGIGKATAKQLVSHGATVVLACRDIAKANTLATQFRQHDEAGCVITLELDLSDFDSVDQFCRQCRKLLPRIDVLILNAGLAFCPYQETRQGLELQMGVNFFGHARLTLGILSLMKKSEKPRLVHLSSSLYKRSKLPERIKAITGEARIDDICQSESDYNSSSAYYDSKLAGMLFASETSRRYPFVSCASVSPGIVATNLGRHQRSLTRWLTLPALALFSLLVVRTPDQGCQTVLYAALEQSINSSYAYYRDCRKENVSKLLVNSELGEKLFLATQEIFNHCDDV